MLAESLVLALAGGALGVAARLSGAPSASDAERRQHSARAGHRDRRHRPALRLRHVARDRRSSSASRRLAGVAAGPRGNPEGRRALVGDRGGRLVRNALLVTEVALSIVLLVGATLLLRSFAKLTSVDPGFRPDDVLAFRVALPPAPYREDHQRVAFFDKLIAPARGSFRDVRSAGMIQTLPMRGGYVLSFTVQGRPEPKPADEPSANYRVVSPALFHGARHPAEARPALHRQDTEKSPMVAVIDEAFAARHFPNEDPIGRGHRHRQRHRRLLPDRRRRRQRPPRRPRSDPRRRCTCRSGRMSSARCGSWPGPTATLRSWSPRRGRPFARSIRPCRPLR